MHGVVTGAKLLLLLLVGWSLTQVTGMVVPDVVWRFGLGVVGLVALVGAFSPAR